MPKYLIQASYTPEGTKGLLKEGASQRSATIEKTLKSAGAKLEAIYYALGEYDVYVVMDAPDNATVAGLSLAINASGAVRLKTTVLLTTEELDAAAKKTINYRPPGA